MPAELSTVTGLKYFSLRTNRLSGIVPLGLASITGLSYLLLKANSLSGTVPAELSSLTQLSALDLSTNSLSGTVPVLSSLTQLTVLDLSTNSLSGTVPAELTNHTKLTGLGLYTNRLSGTVPAELAGLAKLSKLYLHENSLSGAVPVQLADLTKLARLDLSTNRLSGTAPVELANLTKLTTLSLGNNALSGTVPAELANLTKLTTLSLYANSLSGTVPTELANLTKLTALSLGNNSLSGTVPAELASITKLSIISLYNNSLSGTVPAELAELKQLTLINMQINSLSGTVPVELVGLFELIQLSLRTNRLSGTVPLGLAGLTGLARLYLNTNSLSGTVPVRLPLSLVALMLHNNYLSGSLPTFMNHNSLKVLTLFDNNIGGRLRLPHHAPDLQILLVHRNRLSCPVEYNSSSYSMSIQQSIQNNYTTGALIAPGNRLSDAAKPSWALMSGVHFQWVPEDSWREWQTELCVAAAGIVGGAAVVGAVLKAEWRSFFRFRPRGLYEQYSCLCLQLLLGLGACGLVLIPVYMEIIFEDNTCTGNNPLAMGNNVDNYGGGYAQHVYFGSSSIKQVWGNDREVLTYDSPALRSSTSGTPLPTFRLAKWTASWSSGATKSDPTAAFSSARPLTSLWRTTRSPIRRPAPLHKPRQISKCRPNRWASCSSTTPTPVRAKLFHHTVSTL